MFQNNFDLQADSPWQFDEDRSANFLFQDASNLEEHSTLFDEHTLKSSSHSGSNQKIYYAWQFRANPPKDLSYKGDVRRHKFDCELAAAAATFSHGPTYSDATIKNYARIISSADNFYYYGSEDSNYGHDRSSVGKVLNSFQSGRQVVLSSYEAAHIREGAEWLANHKYDFSEGFINSAASLYTNVYDKDGHKVVDGRMFRF